MYTPQLREQVSQGDIINDVPIAYITMETEPGSGGVYEHAKTDLRSVQAVVLTYDCEYDKPQCRYVVMAEVRPLTDIGTDFHQVVREYRAFNSFYLEKRDGVLPESYIDFRRLDRVHKIAIEERVVSGKRLLSLTEEARLALQKQLALFFGHNRQNPG